MLLLHILTKVEDESLTKPGHNHKAREYIIMHSASIATYYKQSNNHAARYILELKSYNMARSTLDTRQESSMALTTKHVISKQRGYHQYRVQARWGWIMHQQPYKELTCDE